MLNISSYSKKLTADIVKAVDGIEVATDERSRVAGGLFDMVHEHHQAIMLLLGNRLHGSAGALLRSLFESYVRGVWFAKCAQDSDIEAFQEDKFKGGSFEARIREIRKVDSEAHSGLLDVKNAAWTALNSYTHGGFRPVSRRFLGDEIRANYSVEEVTEMERLANAFAVLGVFQIAELSNDSGLLNAAEQMAEEFHSTYS